MTKEEFINDIKEKDKDKILKNLNEICQKEELGEECFDLILDLFYSVEDNELISQIDWTMYFLLKKNTLEKVLNILKHKKYKYGRIKSFSQTFDAIFHNNEISNNLYKYLILSGAGKYSQEIIQLLDSTKIDINTLDLNIDEKITVYYKTMGSVSAHIKNNMLLCFQLLEDNDLIKNDKNLLITFVRFYGWNWMGTSTKFIDEVQIKSDSQRELINLLKLYIEGVKEENFGRNLSKDFEIDTDIVRAKQRIVAEQSKQINKQVKDKSLFLSLFPMTHLLIGNKFSYLYENNNEVYQREPSQLQEFSYELEMPLDYLMSPIDFYDTVTFLLNGGKYEVDN